MTIKAHFGGQVFIPEEPVDLPVGSRVEVVMPSEAAPAIGKTVLRNLLERLDRIPDDETTDLPADLATQHDHYLYGASPLRRDLPA